MKNLQLLLSGAAVAVTLSTAASALDYSISFSGGVDTEIAYDYSKTYDFEGNETISEAAIDYNTSASLDVLFDVETANSIDYGFYIGDILSEGSNGYASPSDDPEATPSPVSGDTEHLGSDGSKLYDEAYLYFKKDQHRLRLGEGLGVGKANSTVAFTVFDGLSADTGYETGVHREINLDSGSAPGVTYEYTEDNYGFGVGYTFAPSTGKPETTQVKNGVTFTDKAPNIVEFGGYYLADFAGQAVRLGTSYTTTFESAVDASTFAASLDSAYNGYKVSTVFEYSESRPEEGQRISSQSFALSGGKTFDALALSLYTEYATNSWDEDVYVLGSGMEYTLTEGLTIGAGLSYRELNRSNFEKRSENNEREEVSFYSTLSMSF